MTIPVVDPVYQAARNGMPGDLTATNHAAQVDQFLTTHGITPVYQGNRVWTVASQASGSITEFVWLSATAVAGSIGWLPEYDVDQPFTMPAGVTATGRVQVAVQPLGDGADLQVTLYPDNGSGSPLTTSPLASAIIPAAHITATAAAGSLASAGPLATSRFNTCYGGTWVFTPWTQPAVDAGGAGNFAAPVTSGNWTLFIGGTNNSGGSAIATVSAVQYLGGTTVTGAIPQPSLPQATTTASAAATTDAVIVAGGFAGSSFFTSVWAAPWDNSTGTLGSWSAQQALPAANTSGGMAAWNNYVYYAGGSLNGVTANAASAVYYAQETNGQITAWTSGPSLPQPVTSAFTAVVGDWLIVAGGLNTSGTTQAACWYTAINSDGSLAGWQPGPALPQAVYCQIPGWNLAATDSALVIVSGNINNTTSSTVTQVLTVSADGPAPQWEYQVWSDGQAGPYQVGAYLSGNPGQWEIVAYHLQLYAAGVLLPVPVISVPLPAAGLTPGNTYHIVFRQLGGDTLNNYLQLGEMTGPSSLEWLYAARYSGGPWTAHTSRAIAVDIYNQAPGGVPLHLYQDSGNRITTLVNGSASGQLLGLSESAQFSPGPLNANTLTASSGAGWAGFNGTFTVTSSPPAGATYPFAGKIVNNGTAAGAMEESGGPFPVAPDSPYTVTCRVYSSVTAVQAGCDWLTSTGSYISTGTQTITVTANTWTLITTTVLISASEAAQAYPRVGSPNADGSTIYAQAVSVSPAVPGQVATATQVVYAGSQPSGLVTLA